MKESQFNFIIAQFWGVFAVLGIIILNIPDHENKWSIVPFTGWFFLIGGIFFNICFMWDYLKEKQKEQKEDAEDVQKTN